MNLKEKAIDEYEKSKKLIEENDLKEAGKFAESALLSLKNIIGENYLHMKIVSKRSYTTSFDVDGILFSVGISKGCNAVSVVSICGTCGSEIFIRVSNLKDIGEALVTPHSRFDCDRMLKIKHEKNDSNSGTTCKVTNSEKRLLDVLKDFVRENDMSSSY